MASENLPPNSLGLWGDGDEIAAIHDVERCFEVQLDYSEADNWVTAGNIFAALQRALPTEQAQASGTWTKFTESISAESGIDPTTVKPETLLLGTRRFGWRLSFVVAAVAGLVLALIHHS